MAIVNRSVLLALLLVSTHAAANTVTPAPHGLVESSPATQTGRWLQVQREGRQASQHVQVSTAAEQELSSQRWLDSYNHPIPDLYEQGSEGKTDK